MHFQLAVSWTLYTESQITAIICKICLKELAINMRKPLENNAASNISKNYALLIFLPYFKNKYFLEHLTMVTSGNVTKYAVLHQYEQHIWFGI